jgi:hypothetical protein
MKAKWWWRSFHVPDQHEGVTCSGQDGPGQAKGVTRRGADVPDKAKLFAHGGQGRQDVPEERQGITLTRAVINLRP